MRSNNPPSASRPAPPRPPTPAGRLAPLRHRLRALPRALRQMLDFPDYAGYLEHCQRAGHPPQLTECEFLDDFFAARGRARRCC